MRIFAPKFSPKIQGNKNVFFKELFPVEQTLSRNFFSLDECDFK